MSDFARQVEDLRPQLRRCARAQLRNDAWAEDAVSDTVLAALEKPQAFAGTYKVEVYKNNDTTFSQPNRVVQATVRTAAYAPPAPQHRPSSSSSRTVP